MAQNQSKMPQKDAVSISAADRFFLAQLSTECANLCGGIFTKIFAICSQNAYRYERV
jgi:hypothetical protein